VAVATSLPLLHSTAIALHESVPKSIPMTIRLPSFKLGPNEYFTHKYTFYINRKKYFEIIHESDASIADLSIGKYAENYVYQVICSH
jgi:hypothetical protein